MKSVPAFLYIVVFALSLYFPLLAVAENTEAPSDIIISNAVAANNPERFGDQWADVRLTNIVSINSFEPTVCRWRGTVVEGGRDYFRINQPDWFKTRKDGFFDGAKVRIYRITDNEVRLIRTAIISEYKAEQIVQISKRKDVNGEYAVQGNTYIDYNVTNGQTYYYRVIAINAHNKRNSWDDQNIPEVSATPNESLDTVTSSNNEILLQPLLLPEAERNSNAAPPGLPSVTATANNESVTLSWNTAPDVAGYKIFRYERNPGRARDSVELEETGPEIFPGDYYHIDIEHDSWPMETLWDRTLTDNSQLPAANEKISGYQKTGSGTAEISYHTGTALPHDPGKAYLRLDPDGAGTVGVSSYTFAKPGNGYYNYIRPGQKYRVQVWLLHEGTQGSVRIYCNGAYSSIDHTFTQLDSVWKKYTYDFFGPAYPSGNGVSQILMEYNGNGIVKADNLIVYEVEETEVIGEIDPLIYRNLQSYQTGPIRTWSGQLNISGGSTLEHATDNESVYHNFWNVDYGTSRLNGIKWPTTLKAAKELGGTPWLIVSTLFDEEEWENIVDYLAGDETTEYGVKRIAQRGGNTTPWTEEFDKIRIEFGNETWSLGFFDPQAMPSPEVAGKFFEYFIQKMKATPTWQNNPGLENKIEFICNGWAIKSDKNGYGAINLKNTPSASSYSTTLYNGGWEAGYILGGDQVNDTGFESVISFGGSNNIPNTAKHAATRDMLQEELVRDITLSVYEGGPSYALPTGAKAFDPVTEIYGKSLASAVSTFDSFMYAAYREYGPMCFFMLSPTGKNWSSFAEKSEEYRQHAPWLALKMRNVYASGDMLVTHIQNSPYEDLYDDETNEIRYKDFPLVNSYAFKDGNKYTIFILSRKLDGDTNVTLHLPFDYTSGLKQVTLTGDPRDTNIDDNNINIIETSLDVPDLSQKQYNLTIPAGSIYGLVFEGTNTIETGPQPQVIVNKAMSQDDPTSCDIIHFSVFFDQPVEGFENNDIVLSGTANPYQPEVEVVPGSRGMSYTVTVQATETSGTIIVEVPENAVTSIESGQGNLASTSTDNVVEYIVSDYPATNQVFAYDDFGTIAAPLMNINTGFGFVGPWSVQNKDMDGFKIQTATPLYYENYFGSGNGYALGGDSYQAARRTLDAEAFDYLRQPENPQFIGCSRTNLWISALVRRKQGAGRTDILMLSESVYPEVKAYRRVSLKVMPNGNWGIAVRNAANNGFDEIASGISAVAQEGQTVLAVLHIKFGKTSDRIELFINPDPTAISPPATPDAAWNTTGETDIRFHTLGFVGSNTQDQVAIDDIRFADSFQAVIE